MLLSMFAIQACKKVDKGAYHYKNQVNVYDGNVYAYLKARPAGEFDSLLLAVDRVGWAKDTLLNAKAITLFAITNRSFEIALSNLNQIRASQNKAPLSIITLNKAQLDTLVDRYIVRKKLTTDSLRFADGAFLKTTKFNYEMNAIDKSSNASGLVDGGPKSVTYSDIKKSQYTKDWRSSTTQSVNVMTANAVMHTIAASHEFGFAEFSTRMNK